MSSNKYQLAIEALEERKAELLAEIAGIEATITSFKSKGANVPKTTRIETEPRKNYNKGWSFAKKFAYLLNEHQRFLHFREAAEMINEIEGTDYDISKLTGQISSGTHSLKRGKIIDKFVVGGKNINTFWGKSEWLDKDGNIKKGHEYDGKYVSGGDSGTDYFDFEN